MIQTNRAGRGVATLSLLVILLGAQLIVGCTRSTGGTKGGGDDGERVVALGNSVRGEPLMLYQFGNGPRRPTLVLAAIHGDEPDSAVVGRRLLAYLQDHPELTSEHPVAVLPVANPDGLADGTRTNANGVDVNRNFPAANWRPTRPGPTHTGPYAASEPETCAVLAAIALTRPRRIVSIHSGLHCNNYDGPPAARALAELAASHNGYPVQGDVGYPTPGSLGSWAGIDRQIPVLTLELPREARGNDDPWERNRDAILAVITSQGDKE